MTMISTHRNHSYKANRHDYKKQNYNTYKPFKPMKQEQVVSLATLLAFHLKKYTPKPKMMTHTIYVWDEAHEVKLPQNMDVFEGIQQFYPNLYQEVEREKAYYDSIIEMDGNYEEEAAEEYWAHQDYLEWLCD